MNFWIVTHFVMQSMNETTTSVLFVVAGFIRSMLIILLNVEYGTMVDITWTMVLRCAMTVTARTVFMLVVT